MERAISTALSSLSLLNVPRFISTVGDWDSHVAKSLSTFSTAGAGLTIGPQGIKCRATTEMGKSAPVGIPGRFSDLAGAMRCIHGS